MSAVGHWQNNSQRTANWYDKPATVLPCRAVRSWGRGASANDKYFLSALICLCAQSPLASGPAQSDVPTQCYQLPGHYFRKGVFQGFYHRFAFASLGRGLAFFSCMSRLVLFPIALPAHGFSSNLHVRQTHRIPRGSHRITSACCHPMTNVWAFTAHVPFRIFSYVVRTASDLACQRHALVTVRAFLDELAFLFSVIMIL